MEHQYVGFWKRLFSNILDVIILVLFLMFLMKFINLEWLASNVERIQLLIPVLIFLYTILFWTTMGGSPGKIGLDIKIVDEKSGKKLSFEKAITRYLVSVISIATFFLGYIWILFDKKKQSWHDKAVGSIVIKSKYTT